MNNIVFIGGNISLNKGGAALVISAYESIKKIMPNTEFTLISAHNYDILMKDLYPEINIISEFKGNFRFKPIISWIYYLFLAICWRFINLINLNGKKIIKEKIILTYLNSDLIIEISGDGLSGDYGFISTLNSLSRILLGILLKKKVYIYAQSIGPFNIKWSGNNSHSRFLSNICSIYAKFIFNRVNLITVRENLSFNILKNLKITETPVIITADTAFLLNPLPKKNVLKFLVNYNIRQTDKIIGISVSNSISKLQYDDSKSISFEEYKQIMTDVIKYINNKFKVKILFIPHVTGPESINDDRIIAEDIYQKSEDKDKIVNITEDLTPNELKGIIGNCELFIGSRMHANIAAISMGIPTLAIGYSHKTIGIMKMAGQEEFILNYQDLNYDIITEKLNQLWDEKESVSIDLKQKIIPIKENAFKNALLTKKLLNP